MEFNAVLFPILDVIGTIAFAVSGAMVGVQKKADLFGVLFLGITTAVGGGITRDLILNQAPPTSFKNPTNIAIAAITGLAVFLLARIFKDDYLRNVDRVNPFLNLLDAAGLGIFTVTGAQVAINCGHRSNAFLLVTLGMVTAVGGGLLRDIMIQEIPYIFKKHIYAVASILGGIVYVNLFYLAPRSSIPPLVGVAVTFAVRILATLFKWNLPKALP